MSTPFTPEQETRVGEMIADALAQKAAADNAQFMSLMDAFRELSSTASPIDVKLGVGFIAAPGSSSPSPDRKLGR